MNSEELIRFGNKELIENGNFNSVNEIFTKDYIAHAKGKDYKGHKFIKQWLQQLRSSIPDIRVLKADFYVQDGNTIAWKRTLCGTHKANLMGAAPSGKKIKWSDMMVSRFDGEKITEEWMVSELAGELLSKKPI